MIRPLSIGKIQFNGYQKNTNSNPISNKNNSVNENNSKNLTKRDGEMLVKGFLLGAALGATTIFGITDKQTKNMLNEMKAELDASHDKDLIIHLWIIQYCY